MNLDSFKSHALRLIQSFKFQTLLQREAFDDLEALEYLKSRKLDKEVFEFCNIKAYAYEGPFTYRGKSFNLTKSIVIPLLDLNQNLFGVWIRSIHTKQFYIWLIDDSDKYWISGNFNPKDSIIFESIFDALAYAKLSKNSNIGAALGVQITKDFNNLLETPILAFDNDRAGLLAQLKLIESDSKFRLLTTNLKDSKDFNDFLLSNNELKESKILYSLPAKIYLKSRL